MKASLENKGDSNIVWYFQNLSHPSSKSKRPDIRKQKKKNEKRNICQIGDTVFLKDYTVKLTANKNI